MQKTSSNITIGLSVLCAFIVTFSLLMIFLNNYSYTNSFYSQNFNPKINKVYLIGSSHVGFLNVTYINEQVSQDHKNYVVYNLAHGIDSPQKRSFTLNEIVSSKPKIIIYGISYRDFASFDKQTMLPDPQSYFDKFVVSKILGNYLEKFPNPIRATVSVFQDALVNVGLESASSRFFVENTPFFSYPPDSSKISSTAELEKQELANLPTSLQIADVSKNQELAALKNMISEFKKNNIKVVIFITPLSRIYLDDLVASEKETFDYILKEIEKTDTKVYNLSDKYADLPIWHEPSHVAFNNDSVIYSKDIAEIIASEIEQ